MKHVNFLYLFLLPVLILSSCSETTPSDSNKEPITIALRLSGDFSVDVTQDPITKVSTNDAYGINVYYDYQGDGVTDDMYGYGLFDNVGDMSITLLSGHKYKFTCGLVKDAKNVLYFGQAFSKPYSGYAYPFQTTTSGSTMIGNRFIIGSGVRLSGISSDGVHLKNNSAPSTSNSTQYASINRFYGETDQYEPVPNGTVDIYLKRVVFGAKFVVSGVVDGTLSVTCGDFFSKSYTNDDPGTEKIYSFTDPWDCWKNETPLSATVSINYTSNRGGSLWNLSNSQSITFRRNVMTTVTINVSPDLSGASLSFTEEPLGDDNDINIGINTDGLIDIIVNPS
jgi:hypothetical protein